jgi:hypothetical protein
MEYKKIYHMSDIHIRNTECHKDEYIHVFENVYTYLNSLTALDKTQGIIVITGDILHNKDRLTPLCISLCVDFLSKLSSIMKTIIIAGNHDFNMRNLEQQDALSSILYKRKIDNLYYLRETGIYKFNNINFGVSSLIDNNFISSNEIKNEGLKVALYHGAVSNSKNSLGFEFSDKSITKFNGYDFVLLGDIHYYQYLNDEKTIAYSSSLISQNFSETDEYHGILIWDLINKTSNYKIIKNDYKYTEITINDNFNIDKLILPIKCRLKVNIIKNENNNILKQIQKKYPLITIKPNYLYNNIVNNINNNKYVKEDTLLTIIDKELNNINENIRDDIKQLLLNELSDNLLNINENHNWKLISLQFSNLLTYGSNNYFNFNKLTFDEITGLIGKNSSGKSSLIDIILFTLFNKYSRNYIDVSKSERTISAVIINNNYNTFECNIKFECNGDIYEIIKTGKRQGKKKSYLFDTIKFIRYDFYKNNIKLTDTNNKDTQKIINNVIGDYDNFCLSTICLQNSSKIKFDFFEMSIYSRKEFLHNLLKMYIFENIENKYKLLLSSINKELLLLNNSDDNIDIDNDIFNKLKNEIDNYNIDKLELELLNYKNELNNIINKILPINEKYKNDNIDICIKKLEELEINNYSYNTIEELLKEIKPTTINNNNQIINIENKELILIYNKENIINNNKNFENMKNKKLVELKSKYNNKIEYNDINYIKIIYKNIYDIDIINKKDIYINKINKLEEIYNKINFNCDYSLKYIDISNNKIEKYINEYIIAKRNKEILVMFDNFNKCINYNCNNCIIHNRNINLFYD